MQATSVKFLSTLASSHQLATRFELWSGIGGQFIQTLNFTDGSVTEDVANTIRRQMTATLTDADGSLTASGVLKPYGAEIHPYRGVTYADGSTELMPLGVFGIIDASLSDVPNGYTITLTGQDRADKISRAKFRDYYTIAAGTDLGTAIQAMIVSRVPALSSPQYFNFVSTTGTTTPLVTLKPGDDPWAQAQTLAINAGYDLYFDQNGVCVLLPIPDPTQAVVVANYADSATASIIAGLATKYTNRNVYNHIIVISSGTGVTTPLRAEAWDSNPLSPTYIGQNYGTTSWVPTAYGDIINVLNISTATTLVQAQAAASAALRQALGLTTAVTLNALVNPAHLVNDVVTITRARSGLAAMLVVFDAITIPFSYAQPMQATLRMVTS